MFKKSQQLVVTALCTIAGLIALAVYKHTVGPVDLTANAFEIAGVFILLASLVNGAVRHKSCAGKRTPLA